MGNINQSTNGKRYLGASLEVQWLKHCTFSTGGTGSIPGQGTKIPQVSLYSPPKKNSSKEPPALVGCCRFRGAPAEKAGTLMPGLWEEFLVFDDGFHS